MKIKIVTDSAANMHKLDGVPFEVAPLKIITDQKEYVDDANLNVLQMVTELSEYKGRSGTACPGVGDWLDAFEDYDIVYCVTIISTLSGSYNAALTAKQQYEEENPGKKVFVLDSYSAGPEIRLHVEKIRDLVLEGKDFDTVCKEVEEYKENHTALVFCLESLKNLANNGRVSHAVAKLCSMLGIRLIGDVSEDGQLAPKEKVRGAKKATTTNFNLMKNLGYNGGTLIIDHCNSLENAEALKAATLAEFPDAKVFINPTCGLCSFYAEKGGLMIGFETN